MTDTMRSILTITFDLWNTLLCSSPLDNLRYKEIRLQGILDAFRATGISLNYEVLEKAYDQSFLECEEFWQEGLDLDTDDQLRILFSKVPNLDFEKIDQNLKDRINEAYTHPIIYDPPDLVEDAKEVLEYLKKKIYKIALICNAGRLREW